VGAPIKDLFTLLPGETVWKIRMGSIPRSHESEKGGEKHPYRRFAPLKARDTDPSSYFPNSFWKGNSRKSISEILHRLGPVLPDRTGSKRLCPGPIPLHLVSWIDRLSAA
jgi:hypothetical protein